MPRPTGQLKINMRRTKQEDAGFYHQLPSASFQATTLGDWQRSFLEGPRAQHLFEDGYCEGFQKSSPRKPRALEPLQTRGLEPPSPAPSSSEPVVEVEGQVVAPQPGCPPGEFKLRSDSSSSSSSAVPPGPSPRDWMWKSRGNKSATKASQGADALAAKAASVLPNFFSKHALPHGSIVAGADHLDPRLTAAHAALRETEASLAERYTSAARTAADLADRYRDPVAKLKDSQAAWRRKHDALVRRKMRELEVAALEMTQKAKDQEPETRNGATELSAETAKSPVARASAPQTPRALPPPHRKKDSRHDVGPVIGAAASLVAIDKVASPSPRRKSNEEFRRSLPAGLLPQRSRTLSKLEHTKSEDFEGCQSSREHQGSKERQRSKTLERQGSKDTPLSRTSTVGEMPQPSIGRSQSKIATSRSQSKELGATAVQSPKDKDGGLMSLGAGKSMLSGQRRTTYDDSIDFEMVVQMAKKHNLNVDEVHEKMVDFSSFDKGGSGYLSPEEFEIIVRQVCHVRPDSPTPMHLLQSHWSQVDMDDDGKVSFEEYLIWTMETAYSEEVLVPDKNDRMLRHLAREHGFPITEVERMKTLFDEFDTDKSGQIEIEEFFHVIMKIMKCKNPSDISQKKLKRYWTEADRDGSGEISFEEFLLWYNNVAGGGAL